MRYPTYEHQHVQHIARGMFLRYGTKKQALEECQRNVSSPLTTPEGQRFWSLVLTEIEKIDDAKKSRGVA